MDNIEDILRALTEDSGEDDGAQKDRRGTKQSDEQSEGQSEGLFSGLDPEMLVRMLSLFEVLNQPDDNERFLLALKPLLREENRAKIDSAIRLLKLFTVLPMIKDTGIFGKLL